MNRDHVSVVGIVVFLALLVVTGSAVWLLPMFLSAMYGGWRIGQRLIPADAGEV